MHDSPVEWSSVGPPWWTEKPVLVVGTGPSLKGFDLSCLEGRGYVLAVKEAVWDLPFADACFGLDLPWMRRQRDRLADLTRQMPVYLAAPDQEPVTFTHVPGAIYLRRRRFETLSDDATIIQSGGNSGYGAFNLAYLKRAKSIVLFGFDYLSGDHYCQDRYLHQPRDHNARYFPRWGTNFTLALPQLRAADVNVLNASPNSTVDAFPKVTIEQALEYLDRCRSARERSVCCSAPQRAPTVECAYSD